MQWEYSDKTLKYSVSLQSTIMYKPFLGISPLEENLSILGHLVEQLQDL